MSIWGWDSEVVKRRLLYQYCFTIRNQKRTELKRRYYGCRQCSNSEISSRWKYSTNSSTQTSYSLVSDQDPSPQTNRRPSSISSSASSPISNNPEPSLSGASDSMRVKEKVESEKVRGFDP